MKKMMMAVLALGMATAASAQEKAVELEPRVGINLIAPYESGENCMFGYNIGTMVSIPLTEHFYLQPGISFLSCHRQSSNNVSLLHIPVYASYRFPVKEVTWRFNLGPYAQLGNDYDFGISAEIGLEYNRWFGGIHAYQTVIPDEMSGIFGLSFGYKFQIR